MTGLRSSGSDRQESVAVDSVKTEQEAKAARDKRAADAKTKQAAPETDDSPKRQGDKLEKARDAAAGKPADKA